MNDNCYSLTKNIEYRLHPTCMCHILNDMHIVVVAPTRMLTGRTNCQDLQRDNDVPVEAWRPQRILGDDITEFEARIGPTGGRRGFTPITGNVVVTIPRHCCRCKQWQ